MADYYIVTGGAASNKVLIGMALAIRYKIPLLFGEAFTSEHNFKLSARGQPWLTDHEYRYWATCMEDVLVTTGSCVLVCQHLHGSEIEEWQEFGVVCVIQADPTADEMMAQWTAEQNAMKRTGMAKRASFNTLATLERDVVAFELSREIAIQAAEARAAYLKTPEGIEELRLQSAAITASLDGELSYGFGRLGH